MAYLMRYLRFPRQPPLLAVIWTQYTPPTTRDTISRHLYEIFAYSISCQHYPHQHMDALYEKGSPLSIRLSRHPTEAPVLTDLQHHSTVYILRYQPGLIKTTSTPHALIRQLRLQTIMHCFSDHACVTNKSRKTKRHPTISRPEQGRKMSIEKQEVFDTRLQGHRE